MNDSTQPPGRRDPGSDQSSAGWYRMAGAGFEFFVSVLLFAGIGWWLDRRLDTLPWLTVAGVGIGFAIGLYVLVKMATRMFK